MVTDEKISIVVPFFNEEQNIPILYNELVQVMMNVTPEFEMIFVDDGSTDGSSQAIMELVRRDMRVTGILLRKNQGQTAALAAGFDHAVGDIFITMDGDLQNNPADIPNLLEKMLSGRYDIASGWRKVRAEPFFTRRLPSRIANWIVSKLSGLDLHDFGATLKAYRREIISRVHLYGELHRFIPALAFRFGARVVEVPIRDRKRKFGQSHYNLSRTFRVLIDLITIRFLLRYLTRPVHFFGIPGLFCFFCGGGIGLFLLLKKIITAADILTKHGPLMLLSVLLILAGIQLVCFGLLGELLTRIYFESGNRTIYTLDRIVRHEDLLGADGSAGDVITQSSK